MSRRDFFLKKLNILVTPNVCAHAQINGRQQNEDCGRVSGLSPVCAELLYSDLDPQRPTLHSETANYKRNNSIILLHFDNNFKEATDKNTKV